MAGTWAPFEPRPTPPSDSFVRLPVAANSMHNTTGWLGFKVGFACLFMPPATARERLPFGDTRFRQAGLGLGR